MKSQALGLAQAAGFMPDVRELRLRPLFAALPPSLWCNPRWAALPEIFAPPLPHLVIGAGGAGARIAAAMRQPGVQAVAIQHPRMRLDKFDAVLAARHDGIRGPNVIVTRTALHPITPARLAQAQTQWAPAFAQLRRPLAAVLLGGSNGRYRFEAAQARILAVQLALLAPHTGLIITPSRRTSPQVIEILRASLTPLGAWFWDFTGENPYFGMLACADVILVTADSVSMVSEAVATPAPVYLVRLPGKSARIGAFMDEMVAAGRARNFAGSLKLWDTAPLNDTEWAGAELRRILGLG